MPTDYAGLSIGSVPERAGAAARAWGRNDVELDGKGVETSQSVRWLNKA